MSRALELKLEHQTERWKKAWFQMKNHAERIRLISEKKRFKVISAGRRSGKTEDAKRDVAIEVQSWANELFACGAPTHDQAKKIWWKHLLDKIHPMFIREINKTEQRISLINNTDLFVMGLDKPERWEGIPWKKIWIDEFANTKEGAWQENLLPALNTLRQDGLWGEAWIFGVPEGLNHYYELAMYARDSGDEDWGFYTWYSSMVLPEELLNKERARMSPRIYRQEFEASFESAGNRIYEDYDAQNHTDWEFNPVLGSLIWAHDFNFSPLSSCILQEHKGKIYAVDEIVLESAIARQAAEEFCTRYKGNERMLIKIYGDASGRAGEKHGQVSNYKEIEQVLLKNGFHNYKFLIRASNPAIKDRQNAVRGKILNALGVRSLLVNPKQCPVLDKGLKTTQFVAGSTFQEDEKNKAQHITTGLGYYISYENEPTSAGKIKVR